MLLEYASTTVGAVAIRNMTDEQLKENIKRALARNWWNFYFALRSEVIRRDSGTMFREIRKGF